MDETVGAAATAGLAAAAIERRRGKAGDAHHTLCTDCGTELQGRFCHACGQPAHLHRSLIHLGEELLHGVMHFDGRVFRTLPLLVFRPGQLTREWVHGKRTRYVSPLAMFLFTVFLTFMVLSLTDKKSTPNLDNGIVKITATVKEEQAKVARLEQRLAGASPEDRRDVAEDLADARDDLADAQRQVRLMQEVKASGGTMNDWKRVAEKEMGRPFKVNTGSHWLNEKLDHAFANPELAWYKFKNSFYKFSFLLVPLSIPFVALLFVWKRGFTLYDHGVFVLYSLTFVSLYILLTSVLGRVWGPLGGLAGGLFPFLVPLHMYRQLKGAYQLRRFSAIWRLFMLLIFCSIVSLLFLLVVIAIGL